MEWRNTAKQGEGISERGEEENRRKECIEKCRKGRTREQ